MLCAEDARENTDGLVQSSTDTKSFMAELLQAQRLIVTELQGLRMEMRRDATQKEEPSKVTSPSETAAFHEPKVVHVKMNIMRLYDVRTKEQEFSVRMSMQFDWEMPEGEDPPPESQDDGDWVPEWVPKFQVWGLKSEDRQAQLYTTEEINGKVHVHGEIMSLLVISEAFELHKFPNDCQDLTISMQSTMPTTQCKWASPIDGSLPVQIRKAGMCLDDFELLDHYPYTYNLFTVEHGGRICSAFSIRVKVTRQARYYIINVAMIMFLICSFVLCAWAVHPGAIPDRWGVDFNLILTAVAFKLILNDMLPRLNYLTTLDIYVLGGFVFLAMATFAHSIIPLYFHTKIDYSALTLPPMSAEEEELVIDADLILFYVFASYWLAWNAGYTAYFFYSRHHEFSQFLATAKKEAAEIDGADDELVSAEKQLALATSQKPVQIG